MPVNEKAVSRDKRPDESQAGAGEGGRASLWVGGTGQILRMGSLAGFLEGQELADHLQWYPGFQPCAPACLFTP